MRTLSCINLPIASKGLAPQWLPHYRGSEQDAIKTVADCERLSRAAAGFDRNSALKDAAAPDGSEAPAMASRDAHKFQCDLADEKAVHRLLPEVVTHFGQIDAVVNSASTFEHDAPVTRIFPGKRSDMRGSGCETGRIGSKLRLL